MGRFLKNIIRTLAVSALLWAGASCSVKYMPPKCSNVEITFRHYINPTREAMLDYVNSMTHLLFRDGVIVGTMLVNGHVEMHGDMYAYGCEFDQTLRRIQLDLPPGNYTLVSWGNYRNGISAFSPYTFGVTPIGEVILSIQNISANPGGYYAPSERLYYGTTTFTVADLESSKRSVDMLCAHAQVNFTVHWKNAAERPDMNQPIYMKFEGVPTQYNQTVDHQLQTGIVGTPVYGGKTIMENVPVQPAARGTYSQTALPQTVSDITGMFVTYRMWDADHPTLSIWTGAGGATPLAQGIDISEFFQGNGWTLDNNRRQYFDLLVTIDGGTTEVTKADGIGWIDGGIIKQ